VRRGLVRLLGQRTGIRCVEVRRHDLRRPVPATFARRVAGQALRRIERRGKYLLWRLPQETIVNHLGMTGSWRLAARGEERTHDHCLLHLTDGRSLVYHDPRRFGILDLTPDASLWAHPTLRDLGPEPLDPTAFTTAHLQQACARRNAAIKAVIMDAAVVVGVGNIYAAESLFRAGIRPQTPARRIGRRRLEPLQQAIRAVLTEAIAAGGSTIRDFRQAGGSQGYFQTRFAVYGRGGEACRRCDARLKQAVIAQRSTVWCPRCQR